MIGGAEEARALIDLSLILLLVCVKVNVVGKLCLTCADKSREQLLEELLHVGNGEFFTWDGEEEPVGDGGDVD